MSIVFELRNFISKFQLSFFYLSKVQFARIFSSFAFCHFHKLQFRIYFEHVKENRVKSKSNKNRRYHLVHTYEPHFFQKIMFFRCKIIFLSFYNLFSGFQNCITCHRSACNGKKLCFFNALTIFSIYTKNREEKSIK